MSQSITLSDIPIPRQNSISVQTPDSTELTCGQTCCLTTRSFLCHQNMKSFYYAMGIVVGIILLITISFGINTAIFVGIVGQSWHDYMRGNVCVTVFIAMMIILGICIAGWAGPKCIVCWREIKTSVKRDLEQAQSTSS